jgi:hypothetical protein
MLTAPCHCGAVEVDVPRRPRRLTDCNCSICRRYGTLWAYYKGADVRIRSARGATEAYSWGEKSLRFVRCRACGCITHWEPVRPFAGSRVGVNARNFDPAMLGSVRIRRLDGAATIPRLSSMTMPNENIDNHRGSRCFVLVLAGSIVLLAQAETSVSE